MAVGAPTAKRGASRFRLLFWCLFSCFAQSAALTAPTAGPCASDDAPRRLDRGVPGLPEEVLRLIVAFVQPEHLGDCAVVCAQWAALVWAHGCANWEDAKTLMAQGTALVRTGGRASHALPLFERAWRKCPRAALAAYWRAHAALARRRPMRVPRDYFICIEHALALRTYLTDIVTGRLRDLGPAPRREGPFRPECRAAYNDEALCLLLRTAGPAGGREPACAACLGAALDKGHFRVVAEVLTLGPPKYESPTLYMDPRDFKKRYNEWPMAFFQDTVCGFFPPVPCASGGGHGRGIEGGGRHVTCRTCSALERGHR